MFGANHDIVASLDDLAFWEADSILLDDLFDDSLGNAGGGGGRSVPAAGEGGAMAQGAPGLESHADGESERRSERKSEDRRAS